MASLVQGRGALTNRDLTQPHEWDTSDESDIEMRCWNVFTFYTVRSSALEPMFMRAETFTSLCMEVGICDGINVLKQDCAVVYKSLVSKRSDAHTGRGTSKAGGGKYGKASLEEKARQIKMRSDHGHRFVTVKKMSFSDFLTALSRLALKLYGGTVGERSEERAFERLLMEKLLLHGKCRRKRIAPLRECRHLYDMFAPAFRLILQYYGEFQGEEEKNDEHGQRIGRLVHHESINSMKSSLSFAKWLVFCDDFNLRSSMNNTPILTSIDLAEVFLDACKARTVDYLGKLNFDEFWEALVRAAQVAFKDKDVPITNKVKHLFVHMSYKIDRSISTSINFKSNRDVPTNGQSIIAGMKMFQLQMTKMWRADGVPRSYVHKYEVERRDGRKLLQGILKRRDDSPSARSSSSPFAASTTTMGAKKQSQAADRSIRPVTEPLKKRASSPGKNKMSKSGLPKGWRRATDATTGHIYYYNKHTRKTTWTLDGIE
eukprot:g5269.t1